jgi:hypothetical protein
MKLLAVGSFVDHFAFVASQAQAARIFSEGGAPMPFERESHAVGVARLKAFITAIKGINTPISKGFAEEALAFFEGALTAPNGTRYLVGQNLTSFYAAVSQITQIFGRELAGTAFYSVTPQEAALIAPTEPHWGNDLRNKFPSVLFDLDEAAACIAFSRSTAAVFHLMRIMEVGIGAIARCLGIPDPVKPSQKHWGAISKTIQAELTARNSTAPPNWARADDRVFFADMFVLMEAVRTAWRNPTMHPDRKHTPEEASDIFGAVKTFMRKISSRLDENGDPKA